MKKTMLCLALAVLLTALAAGCSAPTSSAPAQSAASQPANRLEKVLADGKIVIATSPDYAPYEFQDLTKTGQESYVGADMVLARYIASELGVELMIEPMGFDACMAAVGEGKVDMMLAGMVPKPERTGIMDFSEVYFDDGDQRILVPADQAAQYKALTDFNGKALAAQNGTLQEELLTTQLPEAIPEIVTQVTDGVAMLKAGKVAGVVLAQVTADNFVRNYPDLVISEPKFDYVSLGVAAGIVKNEPELYAAVNAIISEANSSGKYAQWMEDAKVLANQLQG